MSVLHADLPLYIYFRMEAESYRSSSVAFPPSSRRTTSAYLMSKIAQKEASVQYGARTFYPVLDLLRSDIP